MNRRARWLAPLAVAAVIGSGAAAASASAGQTPDLPARTAAELMAQVAASDVTALSGTVSTTANLGLPALPTPQGGGTTGTDPMALATRLLTGTTTTRVWVDGPTRVRLQLVDPFAEVDLVRNGTDVWTYASADNTATHLVLPDLAAARAAAGGTALPAPTGPQALTPAELARQALAAVDPTTAVSVGDPATVAGRSAYQLVVEPRTTVSLVRQIVVAVDAGTGAPLRVEVFARGRADAAVIAGFTAIDYGTPPAERFQFTPPSGASVTEHDLSALSPSMLGEHGGPTKHSPGPSAATPAAAPKVVGSGWESVLVLPAGTASLSGATGNGLDLLRQASTPVDGGRLIRTALLSVLVTDDGRVLLGAVTPEVLQASAR
jgi:outer membrane lipoprotein-sorting protein